MRRALVGIGLLLLVSVASAQTSRPAIVDIPYKEGLPALSEKAPPLTDYEQERCKLDLYLPPEGARDFRTIVWFHGGALEGGAKSDKGTVGLAQAFAANGVACVVVEYRLSPKVKYPAYLDDAAASIAWTLSHIGEYGGDPKQVFVGGHSAGGYLAAQVGFNSSYLKAYGVSTDRIAGLVPMSPQVFTHFTIRKERGVAQAERIPAIDDAAPAGNLRADAPRTFIPVGDKDWPARLEECAYFVAMANKVVKHPDVSMQVFADRNHGSILGKCREPNDPAMAAMLEFIRREPITTRPATQPTR